MKTNVLLLLCALLCLSAKTLVHPDRVPEKRAHHQRANKDQAKTKWFRGLFPKKTRRDTLAPCDTLQLRSGKRLPVRILSSDGVVMEATNCDDQRRLKIHLSSIEHIDSERGERVSLREWGYEPSSDDSTKNVFYEDNYTDDRDRTAIGVVLFLLLGLLGLLLVFLLFDADTYARRTALRGWLIGLLITVVIIAVFLIALAS